MRPFFRTLRGLPRLALATALLLLQSVTAYAQAGSTPLIWEARSGTNVVYLFGTIHVGARKLYPLAAAVDQAFAASKVLALEADPTDQSAVLAVAQGSTYQPPDSLAKHISPELMARLAGALPSLGLPIEYARVMRPHMLAMTITMLEIGREGYDPNQGLDIHFAQLAKQQGKTIVELESLASQMDLLNSFSAEVQEAMLKSTLDSIDDGSMKTDLAELVAAWRAGDANGLMAQVDKETESLPPAAAKDFKERLYDERNLAMTDKIVAMLKGDQPTFVAVGTGHLLGPTGIVELLSKRGYVVKKLGGAG